MARWFLSDTVVPVALVDSEITLNAMPVLSNGANNPITSLELRNGLPPALIQNTLDNQTLRNLTVINADVANLALARQQAFAAMLDQQMVRSLR